MEEGFSMSIVIKDDFELFRDHLQKKVQDKADSKFRQAEAGNCGEALIREIEEMTIREVLLDMRIFRLPGQGERSMSI